MSATKWISFFVICWCAGFVSNSLFIEKQTTENSQFSITAEDQRFRSEYKDESITEGTAAEKDSVVSANRRRRNLNMELSNTTQPPPTQTNTATLLPPQKVHQKPKPSKINCYEDDLSCKGRCQQKRQVGSKDLDRGYCYCDPYCESFKDCCSDFDQFCTGIVDTTKKLNDKWRCYDDIWMIKSCPNNSTSIDMIKKCHNSAQISASNYADVIPVTSNTVGKTYKNRFCALCNGVKERDIKSLNLKFSGCEITPPESYGIKEKIKFLFDHCSLKKIQTKGEQRIRKCAHIIELAQSYYCSHFDQIEKADCEWGPYRIVFALAGFRNYKNVHCARCEGIRDEHLTCGPNPILGFSSTSKSFTVILHIDGATDSKVIKMAASCPMDQVYDTFLETCRRVLPFPSKKSSPKLDKYNVALWIKSFQIPNGLTIRNYPLELIFDSLSQRLGMLARVFEFVEWENLVSSSVDLLVVNLYLDYSTIERSAKHYSSQYTIDRILNFTQPFKIRIFENRFTIIKATARLLTCVGVEFFTPEGYIVMEGSSSIYINHTREILTEKQYFANSTESNDGHRIPVGTIAVCRQYLLKISTCNGMHITLDEDEYVILPNNSVYRIASNTVYNQDEYTIINGSVVVCTNYSNTYKKRRRIVAKAPNDIALLIITYVGLSLSVVCLVFVLVTYLLFEELRTLPGINVMNLSTALLVSYFLWLIGLGKSGSHGACVALAVTLHYSFLASFAWMSVIAFNTWKSFSSTAHVGRVTDKEYRRKKIGRTVAVGWLPALVLVLVCLTLDQSRAVEIGYGGPEGCWMNNGFAALFIFVFPIAMSLIWNGVFFGLTVKAIYKSKEQTRMVTNQRENHRQFSVYIKISILMGFTWIFGFLAMLKSSYFKYPFVVLNTLQGVYIAVAFTFNSRVKKLYRLKLFNKQTTNESERSSSRSVFKNTNVNTRV